MIMIVRSSCSLWSLLVWHAPPNCHNCHGLGVPFDYHALVFLLITMVLCFSWLLCSWCSSCLLCSCILLDPCSFMFILVTMVNVPPSCHSFDVLPNCHAIDVFLNQCDLVAFIFYFAWSCCIMFVLSALDH
jgi:hypothetical protein